MKENVIIASALDDRARIYLTDSKNLCDEANKHHHLFPTSLATLGRVMSITSLMALRQKEDEETITVSINGGGPIGSVLVVAQANGDVKGFVGNNEIYLKYPDSNKLAVGLAVGTDGYLKVIKDLKMRNNYTSQVKLQSGEIGDDFAYYFAISEQVKSIVSVGVLVDVDYSCKSAGALLIELMPDYKESDLLYLENLANNLKPISSVLLENNNLEDYLYELFPDAIIRERKNTRYHCDCSKERFMASVLTLPKNDLLEVLQDDQIKIKCEFCEKEYIFNKADIEVISKYV